MNDLALICQKLQGMIQIAVFLHRDPVQAEALATELYRRCREYYWNAAMVTNRAVDNEIPPMPSTPG